jgi:tetratricopeptide (TPR) repeat protein
VVQQYSEENEKLPFNKNILIAREIFAALGTYGITYLPDPNNPYEKTSEDANLVDYVQYPRETLKRKSGDCDDLSNLYSACLESLGIDTALIDLPGHILMMFDTNLSAEEDIENFGFEKDKYIIYQEGIWIPIETTLIGSNFLKAWEEGIKLYNKWKDKAEIIYLKSVWGKYKPATLPTVFWEINSPSKEEIEKKFPNEIENLINTRLENLTKKYFEILKNNPEDIYALNQLGIIYGEYGKYDLALQKFSEILKIDINNSSAYNNMGNIYLLQGELDKAQTSYEAAKELDPEDAGILVNLAWIYYKKGEKEKAKNTFLQAIEISPSIEEEFSELKEIFLK